MKTTITTTAGITTATCECGWKVSGVARNAVDRQLHGHEASTGHGWKVDATKGDKWWE